MTYVWFKGTRYTVSPYTPESDEEEVADRETVMEFDKHDAAGDTAKWDTDVLRDSIWIVAEAEQRLLNQARFRLEELYGIGCLAADAMLQGAP